MSGIEQPKQLNEVIEALASGTPEDENAALEYMRTNPDRIQDLAQGLADQFPNQPLPVAVKLGALLELALKK